MIKLQKVEGEKEVLQKEGPPAGLPQEDPRGLGHFPVPVNEELLDGKEPVHKSSELLEATSGGSKRKQEINIGISASKKHLGEANSKPDGGDHTADGGDYTAKRQLGFPSNVGAPSLAQEAVESEEQLPLVSLPPSTSTHSAAPLLTHLGVPRYHHNAVPQYLHHGAPQQPRYRGPQYPFVGVPPSPYVSAFHGDCHVQQPVGWSGGFGEVGGSSPGFAYYQHQHTVAASSLDSALEATGTMIGNIAKGLLEGAGPVINNLVAQHKVSYW